jgi:DNA-binding NtrC family response regulator
MSELLEMRGYRVKAVNDGQSAVDALEEDDYDVVVLDLKMPGMDGLATLRELKRLGRFTETLILTGHATINSAIEALRMGAYDYLTKPCEIDELVEKIEGAWEKKSDTQQSDLEAKIRVLVESPKAALKLFPSKKKTAE